MKELSKGHKNDIAMSLSTKVSLISETYQLKMKMKHQQNMEKLAEASVIIKDLLSKTR